MAAFDFMSALQSHMQDYFSPEMTQANPNSALTQHLTATGGSSQLPQGAMNPQVMANMPQPPAASPMQAPTGNSLVDMLGQPGPGEGSGGMPVLGQGDQSSMLEELLRLGTISYMQNIIKQLKAPDQAKAAAQPQGGASGNG